MALAVDALPMSADDAIIMQMTPASAALSGPEKDYSFDLKRKVNANNSLL